VSPVKYELRFYIPEDDILHSDRRENLRSHIASQKFSSLGMSGTLPMRAAAHNSHVQFSWALK
jgi:hypothetical protein